MRRSTIVYLLITFILFVAVDDSRGALQSSSAGSKTVFNTGFIKDTSARFINITSSDGLSSNNVHAILQDRYGFMWFATDNGLNRYDGVRFKIFKRVSTDSSSVSDNFITSLAEDIYGNLWVGTKNGLNELIRGKVRPVSGGTSFLRHMSETHGNYVRALYADKKGFLWVAYFDGILERINIKNGVSKRVTYQIGNVEGEYYYQQIFEDSKGRIWLGGRMILSQVMTDRNSMNLSLLPSSRTLGNYAQKADGNLYAYDDFESVLTVCRSNGKSFESIGPLPISHARLAVDRNSNLWAAGTGGVVNGNILYVHDVSCSESVASGEFYCIYVDRNNNVWVGGDNGVSLYARLLNRVKSYSHDINGGAGKSLSSNNVTALMQDRDGLLWIGTKDNGVDTLDLSSEKFGNIKYRLFYGKLDNKTVAKEKYTLRQYRLHGQGIIKNPYVNEDNVSCLYQDSKGTIYIGLWAHAGFNVYNKKTKEIRRYALWSEVPGDYCDLFGGNFFGSNWYSDFFEDSRGNFWAATWEGIGLNQFDRTSMTFTGKNYYQRSMMPNDKTTAPTFSRALNRIYIAGGKYYGYCDLKSKRFVQFTQKIPPGYPNAGILNMYYNYLKPGQLKLPMRTSGYEIIYCAGGKNYIQFGGKNYVHDLATDDIKSLKVMPEEILKHIISRQRKIKEEEVNLAGRKWLSGKHINDIYNAGDGRLYLSTSDGFYVVESSNYKLRASYFNNPENAVSIASNDVRGCYGIDDTLFFVGTKAGMEIFNKKTGKFFLLYNKDEYSVSSRLASCITEDIFGNIWYGTTEAGVNVINPATDKVRRYGSYTWDSNSLPDNNITCLKRDIYGNMWVGTGSGLYYVPVRSIPKFSLSSIWSFPGSERFNDFNTKSIGKRVEGMQGLKIMSIEQDRHHRMWVSTNDGIYCYSAKLGRIGVLHKYLGFLQDNYTVRASCSLNGGGRNISPKGSLAFGGDAGFNIFNPDSLLADVHFPSILVTDMRCGEHLLYSDLAGYGKIKKLHHKDNTISFNFGSSDYVTGKYIEYRYRLKGYEKEWNYVRYPSLSAKYTKIPSGAYTIEIQCTNAMGEWPGKAGEVADAGFLAGTGKFELKIRVAAPLLLSWPFILLFVICFCFLTYLLISYRERTLRKKNEKLERVVEKRTMELKEEVESKNKFFSIISHDLKNPVYGIRNLTHSLLENFHGMNDVELGQCLEELGKASSNTAELLDSLLMWVLGQRKIIRPIFSDCLLEGIVNSAIREVSDQAEAKSVLIHNTVRADIKVHTDLNLLTTILRNLLSNAVKFSPRGGEILIFSKSFPNSDHRILLSVKDVGAGMSRDVVENLFRVSPGNSMSGTAGERGTGLGLLIVNELLNKLGESIFVESKIGQGSIFTISIKYL